MGWTKRQFVEAAYDEISVAAWSFDLTPEMLQTGLRKLDAMMVTWDEVGIRLGYPLTNNPEDSDLDTQTDLPFTANEAVYLNLAVRLAPPIGKTVSPDTKSTARAAYKALLKDAAFPNEMQMPHHLPLGAGNKPWEYDREFADNPDTSPIRLGNDGQLIFGP